MTQLAVDRIGELRADMDGPVIVAGDGAFDEARRVWNAGINRYPAAIARCASTADVAAAVTFASGSGAGACPIRGGAHNTAGTAVCDGGLMIDLSALNEVDRRSGTAPGDRRRRRTAGRSRRGDPGLWPRRPGRPDQPHGRRRPDPRRRHGLADAQVRPEHRQPGRGRGRDGRGGRAAGVRRRESGPVLGDPRRRRQLRRRHQLRVPAARSRSDGAAWHCSSGRWSRARRHCA